MDVLTVEDPSLGGALPREVLICVTDTLECSGSFVVTNLLGRTLKRPDGVSVLVGVSQGLSRYVSICQKAGLHLNNAAVRARFRFLDGLEMLAAPYDEDTDDSTALHGLYTRLKDALNVVAQAGEAPIVLIDDLMSLLWSGASSPAGLLHFLRAVQGLLKPHRGTLVLLVHADTTFAHSSALGTDREHVNATDDDFLRRLLRMTDVWIHVRSLGSQSVGELVVHRGAALGHRYPGLQTNTRARPLQFKLEDGGPKLFAKGQAKEYL